MTEGDDTEKAGRERLRAWTHYITTVQRDPSASPSPLSKVAVAFCFGEIWSRPGLDMRSRRLISLACAGMAGVEVPVRAHIYSALKSGDLTFEEIREAILHFATYAGLPKASYMDQIANECWAQVQSEGGPVKLERPPA